MTLITVNHGQMDAAAGQVRTTWAKLESQFQELQGLVNRLATAWQGDDHTAYQAAQKKWDSAAKDLNQGLSDIGKGVDTANTNFRNATRTNAGMWS
jgi:early secretory antigenic target protein ESAT-6